MNKRIQELLLQSGFSNAYDDPNEGFELMFQDEIHNTECVKRFAALLVDECVNVIQNQVSLKFANIPEDEVTEFTSGQYAGSIEARVAIKQHFLVES